jgi:hypothetical protein
VRQHYTTIADAPTATSVSVCYSLPAWNPPRPGQSLQLSNHRSTPLLTTATDASGLHRSPARQSEPLCNARSQREARYRAATIA